jgi:hypothetical protein
MADEKTGDYKHLLEDETFMSVADLKEYVDQRELAKAKTSVANMGLAEEKRKEYLRKLSTPMVITPERIRGLLARVKTAAAERGARELLIGRFPVDLCVDHGRALNQSEPEWPDTLTGVPRQVYEVWKETLQPLGYGLKAEIIEWPEGLPGEAGMYLTWK